MKENLKEFKKWLFHWLGILLILLLWGISIYLIRARSSSSSWLTVDSSSPAALYVGAGETLTAAKRNRLAQKANWEEVATSDTALFDTGCERRWQLNNPPYYNSLIATNIRGDWTKIQELSSTPARQYINNTTKGTLREWTGTRPILHIRKRCP